jgi:hypothetical protein
MPHSPLLPKVERSTARARQGSESETARERTPGRLVRGFVEIASVAALAEELEQEQEEVDEVEIEPQRAHHRLFVAVPLASPSQYISLICWVS